MSTKSVISMDAPLHSFCTDVGIELQRRIHHTDHGLPIEITNRLDELALELQRAAFQIKRRTEK